MLFRRPRNSHPFANLRRPSQPGRCPLCRDAEAELEQLGCPECRSTAHRACLHELGNPTCPTLGCGYTYPLLGKTRESPRRWAERRRGRIREARRGLREAMFTAWAEQSRPFLVPFFSFSLFAYVLSLGQWINLRPLDAALLVGFLAACTLRVYMGMLKQRERETEDVQRRIQRRHRRWLAALESASNLELSESAPAAETPAGPFDPSSLSPFPSSAWYPQSPPSEWGPRPPIPGSLA